MAMGKAEYEVIAAAIRSAKPADPTDRCKAQAWGNTAYAIGKALQERNPRFNLLRFIGACGGGEPS